MDFEDIALRFVGVLCAAVICALVVVVLGVCVDEFHYDRSSFDAQTACQAKRMEPKRKYLTTHVVCVPINTRQDTTTVNVR